MIETARSAPESRHQTRSVGHSRRTRGCGGTGRHGFSDRKSPPSIRLCTACRLVRKHRPRTSAPEHPHATCVHQAIQAAPFWHKVSVHQMGPASTSDVRVDGRRVSCMWGPDETARSRSRPRKHRALLAPPRHLVATTRHCASACAALPPQGDPPFADTPARSLPRDMSLARPARQAAPGYRA